MIVDDRVRDIEEVGRDPALAALVSHEGVLRVWKQPGTAAAPPLSEPSDDVEDPATWRILRRGMQGADVAAWQRVLMRDGYDLSPWNDDGAFGTMTHNATVSWQRERGLPGTGVVDAPTLASIGSPPELRPTPTLAAEIPFLQARHFTWANRGRVDVIVVHTMEA